MVLPTTTFDKRRRKGPSRHKNASWFSKNGKLLIVVCCFLGFLGWRRSSRYSDNLPSMQPSRGRRDLKEQTKTIEVAHLGADLSLRAVKSDATTFPSTPTAARLLVATHSRLAWYYYATDEFEVIHEGEGVYYGGFPGRDLDASGSPATVWVVSRPHNWRPTTSNEWLMEVNLASKEVLRRVPLPSRFTHDTVRTGDRVYAADTGEGHVLELEFPSMKLLRRMNLYTLKEHVNTLSPTGRGTMWAVLHNLGPSILSEVDLATGKEVRRLANIGLKSHGAVQWRGSLILLDSDRASLSRIEPDSGKMTALWTAPQNQRYLKGLCVVDDIAFFGIAETQERQARDSTDLNCEIAAFDLNENVLLWRRQLPTQGLLNVLAAPHLQVESTAQAVWVSNPAHGYRVTAEYHGALRTAKAIASGAFLGRQAAGQAAVHHQVESAHHEITHKEYVKGANGQTVGVKRLTLLELEPMPSSDPLAAFPPDLGGHWASGFPRFNLSTKDHAHGLKSGAQLPLFRWDHIPLREFVLDLPPQDWTEEGAKRDNAFLAGRASNLAQFKPGTAAIHLIFSDQSGEQVFQFPWYKSRFAPLVEPLLTRLLGEDVNKIIRLQLAIMPPGTHIKRHVDKGGYSADGHRIHLVVASSPHVSFHVCEGQTCVPIHVEEGLVFELNNRLEHYVDNAGTSPRVHLVIDVAETPKERTLLKAGQVCEYEGGRIVCPEK